MQRRSITILAVIGAAISLVAAPPQKEPGAAAQLQAAINKETVEGDLNAAIKQFGALAAKYAKNDRAVAAAALFHLAECYQKKGDVESRKIFEQVVREYEDQKEVVAQARMRLAAFSGGGAMTTTAVWDQTLDYDSNIGSERPIVAYSNAGDLLIRDLISGETRTLTNNGPQAKLTAYASSAITSADGKMVVYGWIFYFQDRAEIRTINTDGTGMRTHHTGKKTCCFTPLSLSPDKKTLLVSAEAGIEVLSLTDDTVRPFVDGFNRAIFSPDGKLVVLAGTPSSASANSRGLYLANADGSGVRPLLIEPVLNLPRWTPDGKSIVLVSERTGTRALYAISTAGGEPKLVLSEPNLVTVRGFTQDGSLFYSTQFSLQDIEIIRLDPATLKPEGEPTRFVNTFLTRNSGASFSRDGKWVAWSSDRPDGHVLVARPTAGGDERVLFRNHTGFWWFPDSQALLVRHRAGDHMVLDRVELADARVTDLYHPPDSTRGAPPFLDITPDGHTLLWVRCEPFGHCELVRHDLQTKTETVEALNEIVNGGAVSVSPDGNWLAIYGVPPGRKASIFVRRAAAGAKLVEVAHPEEDEGIFPTFTFTPDSKRIVYTAKSELRTVPVEGGTPRPIGLKGRDPSFGPDGRLAYTQYSLRIDTLVVRNLPLK
jgi:Tol biopolymer transport system component